MQRPDSRQDTTGLIVNKKVNVRNEYYKIARAKCHHLFLNGFCYSDKDDGALSDDALEGGMSFIYHIRRLKTVEWQQEQKASINCIANSWITEHSTNYPAADYLRRKD